MKYTIFEPAIHRCGNYKRFFAKWQALIVSDERALWLNKPSTMKTILITGASTGLGKAASQLLAAEGWSVIATIRNPEKETGLSKIPNVHLLQLDIGKKDQITDELRLGQWLWTFAWRLGVQPEISSKDIKVII